MTSKQTKQTVRKRLFMSGLAMLLLGATLGLTGFVSAPAGADDDGAACDATYGAGLQDLLDAYHLAEGAYEAALDSEARAYDTYVSGAYDYADGVWYAYTVEVRLAAHEALLVAQRAYTDANAAYEECLAADATTTTTTTEPEPTTTTSDTVLGSESSGSLPRTGSGSTLPLGLASIGLVGIGVALLGAARLRIEQS